MGLQENWSLVAVARDPEYVFVYWGVRLPAGTVLRLLDEEGRAVKEVPLAEGAGNAYLAVRPDTAYRVQLVFAGEVAGEACVRTPPSEISATIDSRWRATRREEKALREALPVVDPRIVLSSVARP